MIAKIFFITLFSSSFCQPFNYNITLVEFQAVYILQREYTGNYTDSIRFCREFHNAELVKFDSKYEYDQVTSIAMTKGTFIIGLHIPPGGDYRNLTWADGTHADYKEFSFPFRGGSLPVLSVQFRYYYLRSTGELSTGFYFGFCICKQKIISTTTTTTNEVYTTQYNDSTSSNDTLPALPSLLSNARSLKTDLQIIIFFIIIVSLT